MNETHYYYAPLDTEVEEGERQCDECGIVTDAGDSPDWPNGVCDKCE